MMAGTDGILVGLEIHQQLDTGSKLFCRCTGVREPGRAESFVRRLRPVMSEMGGYDPAALFEESRDKTILYKADINNSCMVERDEEPPHEVDHMSKRAALVVAAALESSIFEEIYPMRKTVIDGSNTGGFQRTMLVSQGGRLRVGDMSVGVQSICLEEDSARPLGEEEDMKAYALDRLGIPLVEIALEPVPGDPKAVRRVAEALGRLLRGTRMVARGIGTIRQDVNVSVRGGGGIVEVKGVQYLDQLEKVIEYEGARQAGLLSVRGMIQERGLSPPEDGDVFEATDMMGGCGSDIIQRALRRGDRICGIRLRGYSGILGMEPRPGIRLGRELGQIVKYYGVGGVFHTDELPAYGIGEGDIASLYEHVGADPDADALVLVAAPPGRMGHVVHSIIRRVGQAGEGVPAETRLAEQSGGTIFMRPRPGSARMYPETDIPPVLVSAEDVAEARGMVPIPWEEAVRECSTKYGINEQLAEQLLDSEHVDTFVEIAGETGVAAAFVASILCYDMRGLAREGLDTGRLTRPIVREAFSLLDAGKISKESVKMVLRDVAAGSSDTVDEAVRNTGAGRIPDDQISDMLDGIISENRSLIESMGERAAGPLMGMAMSKLRGRAPGDVVSRMLAQKIREL